MNRTPATGLLLALALLICSIAHTAAHPRELDCGGLSKAIASGGSIMVGPVKRAEMADAPLVLSKEARNSEWANYSITLTDATLEMCIEVSAPRWPEPA
jgi:hypothetical protein